MVVVLGLCLGRHFVVLVLGGLVFVLVCLIAIVVFVFCVLYSLVYMGGCGS